MATKDQLKTVCHKDGTVSYWGNYGQTRFRRVRDIHDYELVVMDKRERDRVLRHLGQPKWPDRQG